MEANTSTLLPYVLDLLSRRPDMKLTIDELCEYMSDVLIEEVIKPFGSLKSAVQFAIELGINMGILYLKEDSYLVPFGLRPEPSNPDASFLPPSECRSVINRMSKALRNKRASKTTNHKARSSAKDQAKSKKRRSAAPKRVGAKKRPLTTRLVKKKCATKITTTRKR